MDNRYGKVHPFTCYFCNKLIDNDTEYGHVSNCGSVLEPCVNKCGSYVPRNMKTRHLKECKNRRSRSMTKLVLDETYDHYSPGNAYTLPNPSAGSLVTQQKTGKTQMKEDHFQQSQSTYRSELTEIFNKFQNLDQTCRQLSQNILILKNKHQEGVQAQHTTQMQAQMQSEKLLYQNQIMTEWKRNIEMQIETLKQETQSFRKFQNESEIRVKNLQRVQDISQRTEEDVQVLQKQLHEEQLIHRESFNDLQGSLNEFKDYYAQESAAVAALWNDHKVEINNLEQEIVAINRILNDNKVKYSSWVFDLRAVSQISTETSDKMEIQEKVIADIKKEMSQFKLDLKSLEESSINEISRQVAGTPGRLLWKITNFSLKMESAKENDTIIKSPYFYTHDYGYKVRLQIYLNGIKKWKGRHMIACLHVLKGEYDLLLKWPCHIEGTIILRDLYNHTNSNDFAKYISAKRHFGDEENEEPQESSTQYIFVPHTTLSKQNFINEDTMFIEIRINSTSRLQDQTEL